MTQYAALAKWIIGLAVLVTVAVFGRSCGVQSGADQLHAKDKALLTAAQALRDASNALRQVNELAAQEEAAAAERQREADFAKERAQMAAADKARELQAVERQLAEAMRDPGCRAELEKQTCALLR